MTPPFRIPGNPRRAAVILRKVKRALRARREWDPEYERAWEACVALRPRGMKVAEYLRFLLLHRQFEGVGTPGLPTAVRAARWITQVKRGLRL